MFHDGTTSLSDYQITRKQSSVWQKFAQHEALISDYALTCKEDGRPMSGEGFLRFCKQAVWLSSESNEWYTPVRYIEAARAVLGNFDVDPASNEAAQQIIKATTYYTAETNGLDKEWPGKVWMNPPYGGLSREFVACIIEQFEAGIVTEAIVLVNSNSTETNWFAPLWDYMLCFTDHRINFETPGGAKNGSTHGSVFIYLGLNEDVFKEQFEQFGYIVKRV
jgi:phage N-6-adenine-methyltransferase